MRTFKLKPTRQGTHSHTKPKCSPSYTHSFSLSCSATTASRNLCTSVCVRVAVLTFILYFLFLCLPSSTSGAYCLLHTKLVVTTSFSTLLHTTTNKILIALFSLLCLLSAYVAEYPLCVLMLLFVYRQTWCFCFLFSVLTALCFTLVSWRFAVLVRTDWTWIRTVNTNIKKQRQHNTQQHHQQDFIFSHLFTHKHV